MKNRYLLWLALLGVLVVGLATGPDMWAAPGQHPERQTVPTRTPEPPPPPPPPSQEQPTPPPATSDLGQLEQSLATAWASNNWQQAILLIQQILTVAPDYAGMAEKLYTAYINYGHQLLAGGDSKGAITQFNRALEIKPDGEEALAGLQQATEALSPTLPETSLASEPLSAFLPAAGGQSTHFHLGVVLITSGLLALCVARRRA